MPKLNGSQFKKLIFIHDQCFFLTIFQLSALGNGYDPSFEQMLIPLIQGCLNCAFLEIGPVVLEKKNFLFNVINSFHCYLPLKKNVSLHLFKQESH